MDLQDAGQVGSDPSGGGGNTDGAPAAVPVAAHEALPSSADPAWRSKVLAWDDTAKLDGVPDGACTSSQLADAKFRTRRWVQDCVHEGAPVLGWTTCRGGKTFVFDPVAFTQWMGRAGKSVGRPPAPPGSPQDASDSPGPSSAVPAAARAENGSTLAPDSILGDDGRVDYDALLERAVVELQSILGQKPQGLDAIGGVEKWSKAFQAASSEVAKIQDRRDEEARRRGEWMQTSDVRGLLERHAEMVVSDFDRLQTTIPDRILAAFAEGGVSVDIERARRVLVSAVQVVVVEARETRTKELRDAAARATAAAGGVA